MGAVPGSYRGPNRRCLAIWFPLPEVSFVFSLLTRFPRAQTLHPEAENTMYKSAKTFEELDLSPELLQGLYTEM
eukprot:8105143-Pyramimonas_sp.AAC.1